MFCLSFRYSHLSQTRPLTELVSPEQYQQLEAEAKAAPAAQSTEGTEEEQSSPAEKVNY